MSFTNEENKCDITNIADDIPGIVFQILQKKDGTISFPFFSVTAQQAFGLSEDTIKEAKEGLVNFIVKEDFDRLVSSLKKYARNLSSFSEEIRVIGEDGSMLQLSGISKPLLLQDNNILWNTVLFDITENKKIEQQLKTVLDNAPIGIIATDHNSKITMANISALKMFGYKSEELVGKKLSVILSSSNSGKERLLVGSPIHEEKGITKEGKEIAIDILLTEIRKDNDLTFIVIVRDITERKATEKALEDAQRQIHTVISSLPCSLYKGTIYKNGRVILEYASEGIKELMGVSSEEIVKDSSLFYNCFVSSDRAAILANHKVLLRSKKPKILDKEVQLTNGKWVHLNARPEKTAEGNISWNGIIFDTTDRRIAQERLHFLAYHDSLTGVGNRELLFKQFQDLLDSAKRSKKQIAVLSLAPDGLGQINAISGHGIGDLVLTKVAHRVKKVLGKNDLLVRMAGHRFIALLPDLTSRSLADKKIGEIIKEFEKPITVNSQDFDVTITIGVCFYPTDGEDTASLISHADAALDSAKNNNRGNATVFSEELNIGIARNLYLRTRLRHALEKGEIIAYFQPQVNVVSGEIVGIEALARWESKEGHISPGEFIPVAEEYGFIDELSYQIMIEACKWSKRWLDKGYGKIPMAVNISGRLFHNSRQLMRMVKQTLKETGLPANLLELELTESTAMLDPQMAISVINKLGDYGISCSIDDFGTGYSSLAMLKSFPLKKLKIDRSFILDLTADRNDAAIVKATIAIARALNLTVLAEGVETKRHFDILKSMGCDVIQGYLFSRPQPPTEMEKMLKEWKPEQVISDLN